MADRNVGCVVVAARDGALVGIVTDRDVVVRGVGKGLSPETLVDAVMTRNVASVLVGADIDAALSTMSTRGVRRLPLVDVHGIVHGVISLGDVAHHLGHQMDNLADLLLGQPPKAG
jgi:signal-transduction protein with cAMP-binding, CBS, and nucleotidyltransferase domain